MPESQRMTPEHKLCAGLTAAVGADLAAVAGLPSMPAPLAPYFGFGHGSVFPAQQVPIIQSLNFFRSGARARLMAAHGGRLSAPTASGLLDRHVIGPVEALRLAFWKDQG